MTSDEFRSAMIVNIRAFDKWAWKDQFDNPEFWDEQYEMEDWLKLFNTFMEGKLS